ACRAADRSGRSDVSPRPPAATAPRSPARGRPGRPVDQVRTLARAPEPDDESARSRRGRRDRAAAETSNGFPGGCRKGHRRRGEDRTRPIMDAGSMSRSRAGRQAVLCLLAPAPASVEYVSSMGQTAETGAADSLALDQNRASISFVVTAREGLDDAAANLSVFRPKLHEDDEVIVITGRAPATAATAADSWYSVVTLPEDRKSV